MTKEEYAAKYSNAYADIRVTLLSLNCEKFVNTSEVMYQEFKEKDGLVTCEHSTKGLHLDVKMKFLAMMSMQDPDNIGYWTVGWCSTCDDHHKGEHSFHCELVRNK